MPGIILFEQGMAPGVHILVVTDIEVKPHQTVLHIIDNRHHTQRVHHLESVLL